MTGLNNIIGEIDTDASSAAEQKIADAEKKHRRSYQMQKVNVTE